MNICFIDRTSFEYNSKNLHSKILRGAESILINRSNSLNLMGHNITIINNCPKSEVINGVKWVNINTNFNVNNYDLAFANGDCRLFNFVKSKKKILLSHSLQSIEKFIRKGQLFAYLNKVGISINNSPITAEDLGQLIDLISSDTIKFLISFLCFKPNKIFFIGFKISTFL